MELFNTKKCDVPYVPTYDFNFVDDCTVLPAPPPIFDCPLIDIPFETPIPDFNLNIPCPILDVVTAGSISFHNNSCDAPTFDVASTLTPSKDGNSCRLDLNLDLGIKIPQPKVRCPTIDTTGNLSLITGHAARTAVPVFDVVMTNTTTDNACNPNRNCKYTMDLDLRIPILPLDCPVLTTTTTNTDVRVRTYDPIYLTQSTPLASSSIAASTVDVLITPYEAGTSSRPLCGVSLDFMFDLAVPVPQFDASVINFNQYSQSALGIDLGDPWGDNLPVFSMVRYQGPNQAIDPCCDGCDTPKVVLLRRPYNDYVRSIAVVATNAEMTGISTIQSTFKAWFMGICCCRVRGPVAVNEYLMPAADNIGVSDTQGISNCKSLGFVPTGQTLVIPVMLLTRDTCSMQWKVSIIGGPSGGTITLGVYGGPFSSVIPIVIPYNAALISIQSAFNAALGGSGVSYQITSGTSIQYDEITIMFNDQRVKLTVVSHALTRTGAIVPFPRMTSCCV